MRYIEAIDWRPPLAQRTLEFELRMETKNDSGSSKASLDEKLVAARAAVLRSTPSAAGAAWARAQLDQLRAEGRSIEGGWPGTVGEARALISAQLRQELAGRALPLPNLEEMKAATEATYDRARADWLHAAQGRHPGRRAARPANRDSDEDDAGGRSVRSVV